MHSLISLRLRLGLLLAMPTVVAGTSFAQTDPRLTSWLTTYSGQYARIVETDAELLAGSVKTTWTRGSLSQSSPTYCGVNELAYSANWVYLRTTGLGSHVMGPWYLNAGRTTTFPNVPKNMAVLYRIPRTPTVPASKTLTGLGAIGYFVDGVSMYDTRDAFSYTSGTGSPGTEANPGSGAWNRDAYVNESITFDPALAHQPANGQYHYHANPAALRYLLGDNILFNSTNRTYSENVANTNLKHSPILGWVRDGFPVYGPYGYSNSTNAASAVRRMISGYRLRNAAATGVSDRTTYPLWAVRARNLASTNLTTEAGPAVSTQRPLGRYMEDNDYLGDLGLTLGVDFDLNEYNARFCVTPEFPQGTWAYFVCISSNGAPAFPYNIGRQFYGNPTGNAVAGGTYPETVTTNFTGGPKMPLAAAAPKINSTNGDVTVTWSAIDGGTYVLEATTNLTAWAAIATNSPALRTNFPAAPTTRSSLEAGISLSSAARFYRVRITATNSFDSTGFTP